MVRIGGSVIGFPPNVELIDGYVSVLKSILTDNKVGLVVGGGKLARDIIQTARKLQLKQEEQDKLAIEVSRLNARLFASRFGLGRVPKTLEYMVKAISQNGISVMGGLKPGITTDTVAAMLAKKWHADLVVKCSDQAGIYTADPKKDTKAKKLNAITYEELSQLVGETHRPGIHSIIDPVAVKYFRKSRIKMIVLDGTNPNNLKLAIEGKGIGTAVY